MTPGIDDPPPPNELIEAPVLDAEQAHIWLVDLEMGLPVLDRLRDQLSADELDRMRRFRFSRDRDRFAVRRGALRRLLSLYLGLPADGLRFSYGRYGKPYVVHKQNPLELAFNMSHSHGFAIYGITRGRRIGIDIERIRSDFATSEIAERFFSPAERREIKALPERKRERAFFDCWTRKEAVIKAIGEGLSLPLVSFDVSIAPGEPAALLRLDHSTERSSRWRLYALSPPPGYRAALATEGPCALKTCDGTLLLA